MSEPTLIRANAAALSRSEKMDGQEYTVFPAVILKPMVLNSVLYLEEEIKRHIKAWNGRPVVVNHPMKDGKPISAAEPKVLENQGVGTLFNTKWDQGKLKTEVWINKEKAQKHPELKNLIENGQMMELSTGLFTDDEPSEGEHNGSAYDRIAHNYRPDHLALLPNQTGAMSIGDGAGIPRINQKAKEDDVSDESDTLYRRLKRLLGLNGEVSTNAQTISDLRAKLCKNVSDNLGKGVWIEEMLTDNSFVYEENDALETNGTRALYQQSYQVDADGMVSLVGEPVEVVRYTEYRPKTNEDKTSTSQENEMEKKELVDGLIANEATQWSEDDREVLNGMDDKVLAKLAPVAPKANADTPKEEPKANEPKGLSIADVQKAATDAATAAVQAVMKANACKEQVDRLVANEACPLSRGSLERLSAEELSQLEASLSPTVNYGGRAFGMAPAPKVNKDHKEEAYVMPGLDA